MVQFSGWKFYPKIFNHLDLKQKDTVRVFRPRCLYSLETADNNLLAYLLLSYFNPQKILPLNFVGSSCLERSLHNKTDNIFLCVAKYKIVPEYFLSFKSKQLIFLAFNASQLDRNPVPYLMMTYVKDGSSNQPQNVKQANYLIWWAFIFLHLKKQKF